MNKPLFSALYVLSLLSAGLTINQAFGQRAPAVEAITEVSITENRAAFKPGQKDLGFDFANTADTVAIAPVQKRVPANIATKSSSTSSPYSYIGPLIFLCALPFALWIVIYKKIKHSNSTEKFAYYPKTLQFKSQKNDSLEDIDDDDHNFPKAS
jgi:hypothetical protein